MRYELRIFIIALLAWSVFGVSNVFGQPKQFLPPIYLDSWVLPGIGLILLFREKTKKGKLTILAITLSFLFSAWAELTPDLETTKVLGIVSILFLVFGIIAHSQDFLIRFRVLSSFTSKAWLMFLLLTYGFLLMLILSRFSPPGPMLSFLYWAILIPGFLLLWKNNTGKEISTEVFSVWLLLTLSAFFDLGDYLALKWLFT